MIQIRQSFDLLKGIDNVLHLSPREIKNASIPNGQRLLSNIIEMTGPSIEHFVKAKVDKQIANKIDEIAIVKLDTYPLHVSYNEPTDQIILNVSPFGVDTLTALRPDPRNVYAILVYGMCFKAMASGKKVNIKDRYSAVFTSYYMSMMVQMFGKEYGLLDRHSRQIPMLKYLISCYVLISFFGINKKDAYKMSRAISGAGDTFVESELDPFDLGTVSGLIDALSRLKVLPGITKPLFMGKVLKYMSVAFVPAIEDVGRMVSLALATSIKGSNLIPQFIRRYNEDEYINIIEIGRLIL